jgi:hypothetical protein
VRIFRLAAIALLLLACHRSADDAAASDTSAAPSVDPSAWMEMAMAGRPPETDAEATPDPQPSATISIIATPPPPPELVAPIFNEDGSLPDDFSLRVSDTPCFGFCSYFDITIDGQGNVQMDADAFGKPAAHDSIRGCAKKSIGVAGVKAILQRMTAQGFFSSSWPDSSDPFDRPTDAPHEEVELQMKGRSKTVDGNMGSHWPAKYKAKLDAIRNPIEQMAGVTAFMAHPRTRSCRP